LFIAWMQVFDAFLLDTRVASYSMWLGERFGSPLQSSVMLIAIDDDSERRLGRKYSRAPEWRMDHARMIDRLTAAGVAAIVFDLFIESENESESAADAALADAQSPSTDCPTLGTGSVIATLLLRLSPSGFWREQQRRMSYAQVLDPASTLGPDVLRGKIALIGVTLGDAGDSHRVLRGWR